MDVEIHARQSSSCGVCDLCNRMILPDDEVVSLAAPQSHEGELAKMLLVNLENAPAQIPDLPEYSTRSSARSNSRLIQRAADVKRALLETKMGFRKDDSDYQTLWTKTVRTSLRITQYANDLIPAIDHLCAFVGVMRDQKWTLHLANPGLVPESVKGEYVFNEDDCLKNVARRLPAVIDRLPEYPSSGLHVIEPDIASKFGVGRFFPRGTLIEANSYLVICDDEMGSIHQLAFPAGGYQSRSGKPSIEQFPLIVLEVKNYEYAYADYCGSCSWPLRVLPIAEDAGSLESRRGRTSESDTTAPLLFYTPEGGMVLKRR